jgi:hypothetical protein
VGDGEHIMGELIDRLANDVQDVTGQFITHVRERVCEEDAAGKSVGTIVGL